MTLIDKFDFNEDSDAKRILNALSITSMEDLVNYSFTSSEDSTSRNIESIWVTDTFDTSIDYKYNVSGPDTNQYYNISDRLYTLYFTRRT